MTDPVISGDDVFSHACLGASDLVKSAAFYDAALAPLGVKNLGPFGGLGDPLRQDQARLSGAHGGQ